MQICVLIPSGGVIGPKFNDLRCQSLCIRCAVGCLRYSKASGVSCAVFRLNLNHFSIGGIGDIVGMVLLGISSERE